MPQNQDLKPLLTRLETPEGSADYGKHAFSVIEVDTRLLEPISRSERGEVWRGVGRDCTAGLTDLMFFSSLGGAFFVFFGLVGSSWRSWVASCRQDGSRCSNIAQHSAKMSQHSAKMRQNGVQEASHRSPDTPKNQQK